MRISFEAKQKVEIDVSLLEQELKENGWEVGEDTIVEIHTMETLGSQLSEYDVDNEGNPLYCNGQPVGDGTLDCISVDENGEPITGKWAEENGYHLITDYEMAVNYTANCNPKVSRVDLSGKILGRRADKTVYMYVDASGTKCLMLDC